MITSWDIYWNYKPVSLIDLLAQLEAFDRYPVKEVIL